MRDGFGCAARNGDEGRGAGAEPDKPLCGELRIGRDHDPAGDAEIGGERSSRGEPRPRLEHTGADQRADPFLDLGRKRPGTIEAQPEKWSC